MVAHGWTENDADRMITSFAWKRRLRNAVALVFGAAAIAGLLYFVFGAELPDLDWADDSTRALTEPPAPYSPAVPPAMAGAPATDLDAATAQEDAITPAQDSSDAGVAAPEASVPDIGGPTPAPESAMSSAHQLLKDGDPWKALLAFEIAAESQSHSPDPFYWMGVCYTQLGKYPAAQTQFRRALEIDGDHVASVYGLADAMRLNAQTKESVEWYEKYLALSPNGKYKMVAHEAIDAFKN